MTPLPENVRPLISFRPLVMVTGFLGAGKTTFLRSFLECLKEWYLASDVILNDYENADLDAETLRDKAFSVEALAASCACCDGLEPLIDLAIAAGRSRSDALAIELNGTADPLPLLESFTLLEEKIGLRPRWQVCVLDARNFGKRGYYDRLEFLQLQTASHFVLSHSKSCSMAERKRLLERIRAATPKASETTPGEMAASVARAAAREWRLSGKVTPPRPKPLFNIRHGDRLAHEFTGCQILLPERVEREAMWRFLSALPGGVIRAKALACVKGEPGVRRLFERVGPELMADPLEVPLNDRVPSSAICIGPDLDPEELLEIARRELGGSCHIPGRNTTIPPH